MTAGAYPQKLARSGCRGMRRVLTALLLTSALAPTLMAQVSPAAQLPALVTVTGEHEATYVPDEVSFSFNVQTESEDLAAAKRDNAATVAELLAYLKSAGVAERDIQTRYLNVSTRYRDPNRVQPRYTADQYVSVELRDVSRFDEVNSGLLERGVTGINGPNFGYSKLEDLRAEVRIAAVKDARDKAEALAAALGQRVGPAFSIDASAGDRPAYPGMRMRAASAEAAGPGIAVGESEVKSTVTVSFYLYAE